MVPFAKDRKLVIAVDWDDTIAFNDAYGETQFFNMELITVLIMLQKQGHKLILNTCRGGNWLQEAVDTAKTLGLVFDAIGENIVMDHPLLSKTKLVADVYVDDRAIQPREFISEAKQELKINKSI